MSDMDPSERWRQIDESRGRQPSDEVPTQLGGPPPTGAGEGGGASSDPYAQGPHGQAAYGQNPYGHYPYAQSPYGQNPYGQNPYGQSPYGAGEVAPYAASYPQFPAGHGVFAPQHPSASTALTLGLVGLVGGLMCWLPLFASPFGWAVGARAVREIDASGGQLTGRGQAQAGMICGIIGTAFLVLGVVGMALLVVGVAAGV